MTDHLGNSFHGRKPMCRYWCIKPDTLKQRLSNGTDLKDALTRLTSDMKIDEHLIVLKHIRDGFYEVHFDGADLIMSHADIMAYYRSRPGFVDPRLNKSESKPDRPRMPDYTYLKERG